MPISFWRGRVLSKLFKGVVLVVFLGGNKGAFGYKLDVVFGGALVELAAPMYLSRVVLSNSLAR